MTGALGNPSTKAIVLIASDSNITGLAGLFHLDWILPGYQADFCGPGGALVFQLRQSQSTGEYIVRASYVAQTLDQLRNRTALTLEYATGQRPGVHPRLQCPQCYLRLPSREFRGGGEAGDRPAVRQPDKLKPLNWSPVPPPRWETFTPPWTPAGDAT